MNHKDKLLLIVTGSIAAVKTYDLVRRLVAEEYEVTCVLTKGGAQFVTPMALSSLTGTKTYTDLFDLTDELEMGHIELSRAADLLVVAPASADICAKMANGICDDLATTLLLATDKPVLVAPAMNVKMWEHAATQRNIKQLKDDGIQIMSPVEGEMACGETGMGRLPEPEVIAKRIEQCFPHRVARTKGAGKGLHVVVTSGPTREALDPVRYLTNKSSGKQGHAIAEVLAERGFKVTLISGPTHEEDPKNCKTIHVETAEDMLNACLKLMPSDIFIGVAAVSDWKAAEVSPQKIKKKEQDLSFNFMQNPDILQLVSKHGDKRPALVVGFAAETEEVEARGREKLQRKGCDWLLANNVSERPDGAQAFGSDENEVYFLTHEETEHWPMQSKEDIALALALKIETFFKDYAAPKPGQLKLVK